VTGRRRIRIAVDAMGGDLGPGVILRGAIEALRGASEPFDVLLVGDEPVLWRELEQLDVADLPIFVVHAPEQVEMAEKAQRAWRGKRSSSIAVCAALVGGGRAEALVSAGNTGAVVTTSLLNLGRMPGILRPAIATTIPTFAGQCVILDVGANADCKPIHLFQFAHMGRIYANLVLGIPEPRVGLLNIGEEPTKGSALTQAAYQLMDGSRAALNFVGNVEGRDIFAGAAEVVVCDGFTGNVILKLAGSLPGVGSRILGEEVRRSMTAWLGALFMKPALLRLKRRFNYEEYGGALLLGTRGVSVICHGRSSPRAIGNAIRMAERTIRGGLESAISRVLASRDSGAPLAIVGEA
jgi:glycerol-3-phosphate acyltransferase PlsX